MFVFGRMNPKPTEVSEAPVSQAEATPVKEKKPRSEAQKAATAKALSAMTAKRGEMIEHRKQKKEQVKIAKKVVEDKIIKEDLAFASRHEVKNDFDSLRKEVSELRGMLTEARAQKPSTPVKQERIVERVIERVPTANAPPAKLSGYQLLDKIFFDK